MENNKMESASGSTHLVHRFLTRALYNLALSIAHRPKTYILVPLAVTCLSALGILRLEFSSDIEYLFTGQGTRVDEAYNTFARYFDSYSDAAAGADAKDREYNFQPFRTVSVPSFARLLVLRRRAGAGGGGDAERGDILDEEAYAEVMELDAFVRGMSLAGRDREMGERGVGGRKAGGNSTLQRAADAKMTYAELCARWDGDCVPNPAIQLGKILPKIKANLTEFVFPILIDEEEAFSGGGVIYLPGTLAKPKLDRKSGTAGAANSDSEAVVLSSPGVSLNYILDGSTKEKLYRAQEWEEMFEKELAGMRSRLRHVDVFYFTSSTLGRESNRLALSMVPVMTYAAIALFLFALACGSMMDPIQSKPYFSLIGVANSACAVATTFGICSMAGVKILAMTSAGGLLLLGVGFDDTFVLLAAWRNTCKTKSAADRLAEAYSEAAVSLFITSMTDAVCFFIGSLTPYPGINNFCLFSGVGIIFLLAYQITFFGAIMYYMGLAECENRDALTFRRVRVVEDEMDTVSWRPWRLNYSLTPKDLNKSSEPALMTFFRNVWGQALVSPLGQVLAVMVYLVYIGVSLYCMMDLRVIFERRFLTSGADVSASAYFKAEESYFFDWPGRAMIGIFGEVDYSNRTIQRDLELLLSEVENSRWFADSILTESWLREFLQFVKLNSYYEPMEIDTEESFNKILKEKFLTDKEGTSTDVAMSADGTKITASRFIVQLSNFEKYDDFTQAMKFLWRLCDSRSDMYDVRVYHPAFRWSEQSVDTLKYTIFTTVSAIVAVLAISLLLIPRPSISLWIAVSITSVTAGVAGLMSWLDITLNLVSMIGIILATGFSVDFTAHIAYAYSVSREATPEARARDALHRLGLPMLQGCLSTLIGVSFVGLLDGYPQQCLLRMVFLVMVIGFAHGAVFFPVLLVLLSRASDAWRKCGSLVLHDEDRASILKSCDAAASFQNFPKFQSEKGHMIAVDGYDGDGKKPVPLIHLSCEKSYFTQTLRAQLETTAAQGCCADRVPRPSSCWEPAALDGGLNGSDGVFRRLYSTEHRGGTAPGSEEELGYPGFYDDLGGGGGGSREDRLFFYPAMIVVSQGDGPQTEAQFSCIPSSELSTRAAILAAVESSRGSSPKSSTPPSAGSGKKKRNGNLLSVASAADAFGAILGESPHSSSPAPSSELSEETVEIKSLDTGSRCSSQSVSESSFPRKASTHSTEYDEEMV